MQFDYKSRKKKVEELEEELNKAKRNVRYFKQGIYNTFHYFRNQISKLPSSVILREGKTIYINFDEDNITINVEKESF